MNVTKLVDDVRTALAARHLHLSAQALRSTRLFALTFGAQLTLLPGGNVGWKALASGVVSAIEVGIRAVWKTVPTAVAEQAVKDAAANQTDHSA